MRFAVLLLLICALGYPCRADAAQEDDAVAFFVRYCGGETLPAAQSYGDFERAFADYTSTVSDRAISMNGLRLRLRREDTHCTVSLSREGDAPYLWQDAAFFERLVTALSGQFGNAQMSNSEMLSRSSACFRRNDAPIVLAERGYGNPRNGVWITATSDRSGLSFQCG